MLVLWCCIRIGHIYSCCCQIMSDKTEFFETMTEWKATTMIHILFSI